MTRALFAVVRGDGMHPIDQWSETVINGTGYPASCFPFDLPDKDHTELALNPCVASYRYSAYSPVKSKTTMLLLSRLSLNLGFATGDAWESQPLVSSSL